MEGGVKKWQLGKMELILKEQKSLPDGWTTSGFRFAIVPTEEQAIRLERAFGCERKVYNVYIAGLYEHLEGIGFEGGFIRYQVPSYTTITAQYDYLDKKQ
ncbi:hypothetical protein GCM10020331_007860 [Ectobacillus funiculus]